jgi:hypothetical protein
VDDVGSMAGLALFEYDGTARPSAYAMSLLTSELLPLLQVTDLSDAENGVYDYDVRSLDGSVHRVLWGSGTVAAPSGMSAYTSVLPSSTGTYTWTTLGATITLSEYPVLLR